mgnify:CR=1 FL=1
MPLLLLLTHMIHQLGHLQCLLGIWTVPIDAGGTDERTTAPGESKDHKYLWSSPMFTWFVTTDSGPDVPLA